MTSQTVNIVVVFLHALHGKIIQAGKEKRCCFLVVSKDRDRGSAEGLINTV